MEYKPCDKRQKLISINAEGLQVDLRRCMEPRSEYAHQDVEPEHCDGCTVRQWVIKESRIAAPKPTPFEQLYVVRKRRPDRNHEPDSDDWRGCADREIVKTASCCGKMIESRVCRSPTADAKGLEVSPMICNNCPDCKGL